MLQLLRQVGLVLLLLVKPDSGVHDGREVYMIEQFYPDIEKRRS